ncbi:Hypothetical protein HDN1F_15460 [gamma proteobacterium HdN1]|nr:Hypothetical protein HDN1F_15460 [gamma proteobacterium HdN1]
MSKTMNLKPHCRPRLARNSAHTLRQRGTAMIEYTVVVAFATLVLYFALAGNPNDPSTVSVGKALHDRQVSFTDSVLAP